jgi:hypothetical protein
MSSTFPTATPVQFSPALLDSLDKSTESALTRAQQKSQIISKQVSKQLDSLLTSEKKDLNEKINSQLLSNDPKTNFAGSPEIVEKLDSIYSALQQSAENKIAKSESLINAEKIVTQCLLNNKGKPLKCWEQVQAFKRIAGNP